MNIPFKLALSNTSPHGVLWNPWAATVPTSVDNTILTGLNADLQERYGLTPPTRNVIVIGLTITGDTADAKVSLGAYDTVLAAFHEILPIFSTLTEGGGQVDEIDSGFLLPLSATLVPVIKYIPASGSVTVAGHVRISVLPDYSDSSVASQPSLVMQDESSGNIIDEQSSLNILEE